MAKFTQSEIEGLIGCPKTVSDCPKPLSLEGAHWRQDARLTPSDETKGTFSMFVRRNATFDENFSVGLVYSSSDGRGDITLLRCNGKHGEFNSQGFDPEHPHFDYHIHTARESAIDAGQRPEKYAVKTTEFASLEEALLYFVKEVGIDPTHASKYFASNIQFPLFKE